MESCSSQVTVRPANNSPIQSSPGANDNQHYYNVKSMHRYILSFILFILNNNASKLLEFFIVHYND